jgi:hypothetical protein
MHEIWQKSGLGYVHFVRFLTNTSGHLDQMEPFFFVYLLPSMFWSSKAEANFITSPFVGHWP